MRWDYFRYLGRMVNWKLGRMKMTLLLCSYLWNMVPIKYCLSFNMGKSISLVPTSGIKPWDTVQLDTGLMPKISTLMVISSQNDPLTSGAPNAQLSTPRKYLSSQSMVQDLRNPLISFIL